MQSKVLKTVENLDLKISGLKIISRIGEGGMSVVYLAEQISLKREVAVKVMRLEIASNDLDVQRFKHEAKTIAHLDHPNIINIYNIGQTSKGEVFFTMPYLNHGDFSSYILEDEQEFIELLKTICEGLSFAHQRGVIHRDIKPENLLFDKFGNVRIADFGIALSKDGTRMTKEHQIVGSAQYMSPEQARSLKVDIHTDIYSLGIVIYERLTGKVPFDSDDSISILVNHVSTPPPKLPSKMRHWQNLIDKCLAKEAGDRYQSMQELKQALDKIPVNSFQRTNSQVQNMLASEQGRHLKWFVPGLLALTILAFVLFNSNKKNIINTPTIANAETKETANNPEIPAITKLEQTGRNLSEKDQVASQNSEETDSKDSHVLNPDEKTTDVNLAEIATQNTDETQPMDSLAMDTVSDAKTSPAQASLNQLIEQAKANIKIYQLSRPKANNATDQLLQALALDENNADALAGLNEVGRKYYQLVNSALNKKDFNVALKHSRSLAKFNQKTNFINSKYDIQKKSLLDFIKKLDISSESVSAEQVLTLARIVKTYSANDPMVAGLEALAKEKSGPQIGERLLDEQGIETILISKEFAVMTKEVSVDDYSQFVQASGRSSSKCRHRGGGAGGFFGSKAWNKPFFKQTHNHPVTCVSQADAQAYADWLSKQTKNHYRLPTRQEWLMLAATENNPFSACKTANVAGVEAKKLRNKEDNFTCNDGYKFTSPVASFAINGLGIYDIQGNVSEWLHCQGKQCQQPIALGSSWLSGKKSATKPISEKLKSNMSYSNVGFRLVRDL